MVVADIAARQVLLAGFGQQLADHVLALAVLAFAEMVVADLALRIDEVMRRPVLVVEAAPDRIVVVQRDRVVDAQILHRLGHVGRILLEREFRRVHADHHQAVVLVLVGPAAHVRQRADAVDAGVGPEIDQHHLAAQRFGGQRRAVQPLRGAGQRRHRAFHRQRLAGFQHGSRRRCRAHGVDQLLLDAAGAGQRDAGEQAGIQAQRDRGHAAQHQHAERAAHPFAGAERALHQREHLAADQQRQAQRGGRAGGIGEQQQGGLHAGAVQRRAGQQQAQDRPRARRPQQAGGHAEAGRAPDRIAIAGRALRQPVAQRHERAA